LIAEACDGVLLVVRSAVTQTDLAIKARQQFRPNAILGVVLNDAEPKSTYGSYYYSAYASGEKKNEKGA
jgi:Mrp family chromosome partitioning ATPase